MCKFGKNLKILFLKVKIENCRPHVSHLKLVKLVSVGSCFRGSYSLLRCPEVFLAELHAPPHNPLSPLLPCENLCSVCCAKLGGAVCFHVVPERLQRRRKLSNLYPEVCVRQEVLPKGVHAVGILIRLFPPPAPPLLRPLCLLPLLSTVRLFFFFSFS